MIKLHLFTSEGCPKCEILKKVLKKNGTEFIELNVVEDDVLELAREKEIMTVPTAIIIDWEGKEIKRLEQPSEEELLNALS